MKERFEKKLRKKEENAVNQLFSFFFFFNFFHSIKEDSSCFRLHFNLFVFWKHFQFKTCLKFYQLERVEKLLEKKKLLDMCNFTLSHKFIRHGMWDHDCTFRK